MKAYFLVPGPDGGVFEQREADKPTLGSAQALIKVHAAGSNRGEVLALPGYRSSNPDLKPVPSGIEFAGEIVEIGPDATGWRVGERVMGRAAATYAEYVAVSPAQLMRIPDSLSWAQGAAIPNVFVTAYDALATVGKVQAGETVLITAAASGIGTAAIKLAKFLGAARIIATSRSSAKAAALKAVGADEVFDTSQADWVDQLQTATEGKGADVIIDSVGGPMLADNLKALAIQGRLINVGRNGGKLGACDMDMLAFKRASLIGVTFRTRTPQETLQCLERFATACLDAFERGELQPVLDRTFPFDNLADAHAYMMSDSQVGKIVVTMD
ncbi:MAG: zinc-binding dehydrogenase [Ramlibacter sp.]|nr:zinc-binding dehydrogenase [Ramlibacter sp.]